MGKSFSACCLFLNTLSVSFFECEGLLMRNRWFLLIAAGCLLWGANGCKTAVEPSPEPGIFRVLLKAADSDTSIIIQNDTSQFSRWDNFNVIVSQGRLYRGENYAYIYNNPSSARKAVDTVNVLAREWLNGVPITFQDTTQITPANSRFSKYVIFESYVPPGTYTKFSFTLTASEMEIFIPKHYLNPVGLPPGVTPSLEFIVDMTVNETGVTELELEISPYRSLRRYQDQFYFERQVRVKSVQNL